MQELKPSSSRSSRNHPPRNQKPTEREGLADGIDRPSTDQCSNPAGGKQGSDDRASGSQTGTSGGVSGNKDTPPADGEWAEQIRERDELISTLKRQLTALGEQPIEEVVTLEVPNFLQS